ncbi:heat-inducible transcriptional repressor HrcA [Jeotgalibaca ciconiae]|uniref:Heat-inducible transcription repressor HrcA n=1 Tax=Jeotgalibaca ciconiae TaxID=2496265 RepID=A0A3Q9BLU0_9LACT|nr:heat-inducible transcriptional repressor HrcA [Jeotgalibaca ciconiae]AZP05336.1 heat-inducible transcription repressor HrcA [Jeotgalibaca ciconiae]HJB23764.1 heat-inducible transcriptional repressor HrcA [Candidatus Jeotgalibaca pullicola]
MLTERQLMILNQIIKHYIEHGEPLGSKSLLNEINLSVSPATIRNDMMRIEELGYLEKMHASSGRIPSILGYRHYVDYLLQQRLESSSEDLIRKKIKRSIRSPYKEAQEIIETSAEMLSYLTNYTALSIGPEKINSKLTGFRLVPVTSGQYMAILVTDKGYIESKMFSLGRNFDTGKLEKIINIFNEELAGLQLNEVYLKLQTEIPALVTRYVGDELDLFSIFKEIISKMDNDRIYIGGEMNLLNYFDFDQSNDREKIKSIYSLIHQSNELHSLLLSDPNQITVRIGTEMNNELLNNLSLITATYSAGRSGKGLIALLGPTNMPYDEIIKIMRVTSDELSDSMHDFYEE